MVHDAMPFDVRAVGLCQYGVLNRDGGGVAERVLKHFDTSKLLGVSLKDGIGVLVVDPNVDGGRTQIAWWIDTAHGYVPVRHEVRLVSPLGFSNVYQRLETTWQRVNGTMVPAHSLFFP